MKTVLLAVLIGVGAGDRNPADGWPVDVHSGGFYKLYNGIVLNSHCSSSHPTELASCRGYLAGVLDLIKLNQMSSGDYAKRAFGQLYFNQ